MFIFRSWIRLGRGATCVVGMGLVLTGAVLAGDVPECYRPRWAGVVQPGAGGNCSAYTECPTAIICTKPGMRQEPAGATPNVAVACVDYINGSYDSALGRCTGGTKVMGAPSLTRVISVDNCSGACTAKIETPEDD